MLSLNPPRNATFGRPTKQIALLLWLVLLLAHAAPAAAQILDQDQSDKEAPDRPQTEQPYNKDGFLRSLNELFAPKEWIGDLARIGSLRDRKKLFLLGTGVGLTAIALKEADEEALAVFKRKPVEKLGEVMNFIGSRQMLYPTLIGTFFAGKTFDKPGVSRLTAQMTQALLLTDLVVVSTKVAVRRTRPDGSNSMSFPSGHTAGTFALATVVHRNYGPKASIPAYAVATLVGASRLNESKHFLSDTIAGAMIGIIVGNTVADRFKRKGIILHPVHSSIGGAGIGLTIEF
jgi:hypothetical protein